MDYIKDLFSWNWEWNRFKFWVYPLPLIAIYIFIVAWVTFSSLSWQANEAKIAFVTNQEKVLEMQIDTYKTIGHTESEIESMDDIVKLKESIQEVESKITQEKSNNNIAMLASLLPLIGLLYLYVTLAAYAKRLRDLWKEPWMIILYFIPLANIYLWIICGFFKG